MESVRLYNNLDIVLGSDSSSEMSSEMSSLLERMTQYEEEIGNLTYELSEIDQSISDYLCSCQEVADNINQLGDCLSGGSSNIRGIFAFGAAGVKVIGLLKSHQRKTEAQNAYRKKVIEISEKKKAVAEEKLPHIMEVYQKYIKETKPRFEKLYSKEFDIKVDMNDALLDKKSAMFKNALRFVIRSRFLISNMEYCIAEMEAWKKDKNDSSMACPSIYSELCGELETWTGKLGDKDKGWRDLMKNAMFAKQGKLPIPIVSVLTSPCLLRSFVGINIGEAENCPEGIIQLSGSNIPDYNRLVTSNPYYIHCVDVYSNKYNPPHKPIGFDVTDCVKLLLIPIAFFAALLLLFHIEASGFWRIFFMIPLLCWVGLGIESIENHYESYFPYVNRIRNYNSRFAEFHKEINKAEDNNQDFHII